MPNGCVLADHEFLGNLGVSPAEGDEFQDLQFATSEFIQSRAVIRSWRDRKEPCRFRGIADSEASFRSLKLLNHGSLAQQQSLGYLCRVRSTGELCKHLALYRTEFVLGHMKSPLVSIGAADKLSGAISQPCKVMRLKVLKGGESPCGTVTANAAARCVQPGLLNPRERQFGLGSTTRGNRHGTCEVLIREVESPENSRRSTKDALNQDRRREAELYPAARERFEQLVDLVRKLFRLQCDTQFPCGAE